MKREKVIKNKIIVTDVDGVLLNWEDAFHVWMEHQGFKKVKDYKLLYHASEQFGLSMEEGSKWIQLFNQSAAIGFLPPLRDAQEIVRLLNKNHGYRFVVCTSLSTDKNAQALRTRNLKKIFGDVFDEFVYLGTGADKDDALYKLSKKYNGCFWVEDNIKNCYAGAAVDFRPILMEHGYNMKKQQDFFVARNWEDIYLQVIRSY